MDYDRRQISISYNTIENGSQIIKYFSCIELFFCLISLLNKYTYIVYSIILFSYIGNNGSRFLNLTYLKIYSIYLACSTIYYILRYYVNDDNCILCISIAVIHFFILYVTILIRLECQRLKIILGIMSQQQ